MTGIGNYIVTKLAKSKLIRTLRIILKNMTIDEELARI